MKKIIAITALLLSACFASAQQLAGYEYFFDDDPGVGNATYVSITPAADYSSDAHISTTGLPGGFHTLCIRFKDANNNWGTAASQRFLHLDGNGRTDSLVMVEAFFGTEPGMGNGVQVPIAPAAVFDGTINIVPPAGTSGAQLAYVRIKNGAGLWSTYQVDTTDITLSVNEVATLAQNGISVYPVPASESLTLDFDNNIRGMLLIQLYDVTGRNVMSRQMNKTAVAARVVLDLNTLPAGAYYVQVSSGTPFSPLGGSKILIAK